MISYTEYNEIVNKEIEKVKSLMLSKGEEYATNSDPLHNFRAASAIIGDGDMKKVLAGYMMKHTVSVYDMIQSSKTFPIEKWEEKITDHIIYLIILRACIEEEHKNLATIAVDETKPFRTHTAILSSEMSNSTELTM